MALSIDQKRLKATKFPPEFDKKVDIEKVNIDLIKKWIAGRITNILGDEDDIVVETCYNLVEQNQSPKIKEIQIQLTGFLGKDTAPFCKELWNLMLSAQDSPVGVPRELLEAKKAELQQEQLSKAAADARRAEEQAQNAMIDAFRDTERSDRPERGRGGGGRYRGNDRRGRGRDFDRGPPRRDSRSPPRRRFSPPTRERDVYIPGGGRGRGRGGRRDRSRERRRSPSGGRSASPPRHRPLAARDADRLLEASLQPREGAETGRGLLVTTLRDYPGILHVPNPHVSNRAHQRPGCDHEPHRAVAVALQVVHDL
ncbi:PWI domain containing protein [Pyrenophora tritici-repentis]|nr:PWI multi-domain protein [Pyrenophora tritici-repentis]KAI1541435.1 PWI domain containing protein [Pyrenophora tritici-repentis]KAI1564800.1 PWI domain containing protein [Pyrenophora tritici-repentis]KAI1569567.1 PWI domain containing protein [Pyrenophora tritici-repentis]KAI1584786.1 PWI domain containing protein [Pyrenophora tritici-repentis]